MGTPKCFQKCFEEARAQDPRFTTARGSLRAVFGNSGRVESVTVEADLGSVATECVKARAMQMQVSSFEAPGGAEVTVPLFWQAK